MNGMLLNINVGSQLVNSEKKKETKSSEMWISQKWEAI